MSKGFWSHDDRIHPRHPKLPALVAASVTQHETNDVPALPIIKAGLEQGMAIESFDTASPHTVNSSVSKKKPKKSSKARLAWTISSGKIFITMKDLPPLSSSAFSHLALVQEISSPIAVFRQKLKVKVLCTKCLVFDFPLDSFIRPWTNNRFLCHLYALVDLNTESAAR